MCRNVTPWPSGNTFFTLSWCNVVDVSDGPIAPPASLRPSNGGQDCPGVNYEYQLCNTDDCPKHFEDFRAQQCQLRNSHFEFQSAKHHWLPYEHPDGELVPRQRRPLVVRCKLTAVSYLDSCSCSKELSGSFQSSSGLTNYSESRMLAGRPAGFFLSGQLAINRLISPDALVQSWRLSSASSTSNKSTEVKLKVCDLCSVLLCL